MSFIPKKSQEEIAVYENYLLNGNILKIDGGASDYVEVIPRGKMDDMAVMGNVGKGGFQRIARYTNQFYKAIQSLKEDYVVVQKTCKYSGCGRYTACIYYLA